MPGVTSKSNSSLQKSSLLHHPNVRRHEIPDFTGWLTFRAVGWFATKIFHPNVSTAGEICVNTLKKDWNSSYGIGHILITVKCLLIYPNPESALDEEAGKLLLDNYDSYCERAKLITSVHATPRVRPPEFDIPSSSSSAGTSASATSSLPKPATLLPSQSPVPPAATAPVLALPAAMPPVSRKSTSPAPVTRPLRSSPSNTLPSVMLGLTSPPADKDSKEGHTSPSPLSTADANVGAGTGPAGAGLPPAIPASQKKAVKRAATGGGVTGVEKRKKALKRL
jgi:ubiquitin-conjugating enzyme E2 S